MARVYTERLTQKGSNFLPKVSGCWCKALKKRLVDEKVDHIAHSVTGSIIFMKPDDGIL